MTSAIKVTSVFKNFEAFKSPSQRMLNLLGFDKTQGITINALHDISFELSQGEAIGIIGRNGSGKTTLLKILARELIETVGSVEVNGTVQVLRLGVGLDIEMTGLENIKNVLKLRGINAEEMLDTIEEIREFSELGEFLSYPVRVYSSGMQSRLAFALALHQEFDILLIDEVLAVGDSAFSAKCFGEIEKVCQSGKSVIIVTHDAESVKRLCSHAIWLEKGKVFATGEPRTVVNDYTRFALHGEEAVKDKQDASPAQIGAVMTPMTTNKSYGTGEVECTRIKLLDAQGNAVGKVKSFEELRLELDISLAADIEALQFGFVFYDWMGLAALHANNDIARLDTAPLKAGDYHLGFDFRMPGIRDGRYHLHVGLQDKLDKTILYWARDGILELTVDNMHADEAQGGYAIIETLGASIKPKSS